MAHPTQQPHPRLDLKPNVPDKELYLTLYPSALCINSRGPRGGFYSTAIPRDEISALLAFLREHGAA